MHTNHKTKPSSNGRSTSQQGPSWPSLIHDFIVSRGGRVTKKELDAHFENHPKARGRKFWRELISRTVQLDPRLVRLEHGVWGLRENVTDEDAARLDAERRERWPRRASRAS